MRACIAALVSLASPLAIAQDDPTRVEVEVGTAVGVGVRNALGWFCDDPSLVDAAIETRQGLNYWVVTGARPGTTTCRVGTDPSRSSFVFEVTVNPAPSVPR